MTAVFSVSKDFGPTVVIVLSLVVMNLFFVWQSAKREMRQEKRLDEYNDRILPIMVECKEAVVQNSQIITNWLSNVGR
jgi:hypothetical protein